MKNKKKIYIDPDNDENIYTFLILGQRQGVAPFWFIFKQSYFIHKLKKEWMAQSY